ncbi:MAG TPA: hypothetical protein VGP94_15770 [Tepidisphaeraceae bacterium]|nr:hypothetical protein [Tepidisphaeraceae bacterium]
MRLLILSLAVLFALAQRAGGENPAPDNWPKAVEALGAALSENDAGALLAVLSEDVSITTFDTKNGDAIRLLARTKRGALISSLNYVHAPETMANDVAEAFKNAEVPEELKRKMAIRDDAHARRANRTVVTWLTESLGAKQGEKVGVLVFWCDKPANGDAEVVFILVKGDPESQFTKIKAICFGNPLPRSSK